jgi:hypothetical protein
VHHPVPVRSEIAFLILENSVRWIQRIHGVKQPRPNDREAAQLGFAPAKPEAPPELVAQTESVDLALACEEKRIVAEFVGNGRDRMKVMLLNKSGAPLHITVAVGQMFESDHNSVLTVRPGGVDVEPGRTRELALETVAIHSSNNIGNLPYELSYANVPRLEPLLTLVQSRPELASGAIQTAILAICENLPLSSFAKFTLASNPLPSRYSTDAFRADTVDIIQALSVLRELKVKDESLALTIRSSRSRR